jgi:hypothetical protein
MEFVVPALLFVYPPDSIFGSSISFFERDFPSICAFDLSKLFIFILEFIGLQSKLLSIKGLKSRKAFVIASSL